MSKIHLEYQETLRADYTKNYFEIIFDKDSRNYDYIYLYNFEYGTIKLRDGKKEIHKWETEDEAQQGSYLNRHYQIICLNGITQNRQLEDGIINENMKYIETLNLSKEESEIIRSAIKYLENTE